LRRTDATRRSIGVAGTAQHQLVLADLDAVAGSDRAALRDALAIHETAVLGAGVLEQDGVLAAVQARVEAAHPEVVDHDVVVGEPPDAEHGPIERNGLEDLPAEHDVDDETTHRPVSSANGPGRLSPGARRRPARPGPAWDPLPSAFFAAGRSRQAEVNAGRRAGARSTGHRR
jgi:hypothetical protein